MSQPESRESNEAMRIAITGASGLIGSQLQPALTADGHQVRPVSRKKSGRREEILWKPSEELIEAEKFEGLDAVIHLAGENIFGLWTKGKKKRIMQSRSRGTRLVATTLAGLDDPPEVLVSASGVDFYGDTGDEEIDETAPSGDSFLAAVCREWEAALRPAEEAGIRTIRTRFGAVLSSRGGALATMQSVFKLGIGGKIGSGEQFMSWVSITDVVEAIRFLLEHDEIDGAVNVTSPNPVTNAEFTDTLGEVLHRPTLFTVPAPLFKLGTGQMGEEMILQSGRVVPRRLIESGFEFRFPELEAALEHELG